MFGVHAVCQYVFAPAGGEGGIRRILALRQVVEKEGKMRGRDDFDHFGLRIKSGIGAVSFRGGGCNQLPGSDQRKGCLFRRIHVAGGENGGCEEKCGEVFHVCR